MASSSSQAVAERDERDGEREEADGETERDDVHHAVHDSERRATGEAPPIAAEIAGRRAAVVHLATSDRAGGKGDDGPGRSRWTQWRCGDTLVALDVSRILEHESRPSPEALLQSAAREERSRLKI